MPLYAVCCTACSAKSEILLRRDEPLPVCPVCASNALTKEIAAPAAPVFVGGGWAKDGYSSSRPDSASRS